MLKNLRKYLALSLSFIMLFSLASCTGAGDVVDRDTDVSGNESDIETDVPEPVDENDPLYANSALAARNVYEVTRIASPHTGNGYYVKGGNAGKGVYFIYSMNDEYNNYAYFVELYDNTGALKDSFHLSEPVGNDYYENEKTDVVEANEVISGIRYDFPIELMEENNIKCDAVDDYSYGSFYRTSDGGYVALLTIWGFDSRGDYLTEYFNVRWDQSGECTDVIHLPIDVHGGYVSYVTYLPDDSMLIYYGYYNDDNYEQRAVLYGSDRFDDIGKSVIAKNDDLGSWASYLGSVVLIDDKPVAIYWDYENDGKVYASEIDTETLSIIDESEVKLLGGASNYAAGATDDGDIIFGLDSGLQSWKSGEKGALFMDYINSDIASQGCSNFVSVNGLDEFFAAFYFSDNSQGIALCKAVDPESVTKSKVITLAGNRLYGDLMDRIVDFNTSDNGFRIVFKDYSFYATYDDYNAGIDKMYEDMMNGRMADIVSVDYMSEIDIRSLVKKELIADIGELIDKDPSLSMDDFCTNVFDAASINGKLYQVIPTYTVNTLFGSPEYLDGMTSWNVDTFLEYAESAEANGDKIFGIYTTRQEFLSGLIDQCGYEWVDMDTLTCDFNDPGFYRLIGYSLTLPEYVDYNGEYADFYWNNYDTLMMDGFVRLKSLSITDFKSDYFSSYASLDAAPVFIGLPSNSSNGSSIGYSNYFMLNRDSLLLDESWEFVKCFITDYHNTDVYYGFPVLKSALETDLSMAAKPYTETGSDGKTYEYTYSYYVDGEPCQVPVMDQTQVKEYEDFILSVDRLYFNEQEIRDVLMEELNNAAQEGKTPEETASHIQVVVQDYLDGLK